MTMVTAIGNGSYVSRNISQFKMIISKMVEQELPNDKTLDAWEDDNKDINPPQRNPQLNVLSLKPTQPVFNRRYPIRIKHQVLSYRFKE